MKAQRFFKEPEELEWRSPSALQGLTRTLPAPSTERQGLTCQLGRLVGSLVLVPPTGALVYRGEVFIVIKDGKMTGLPGWEDISFKVDPTKDPPNIDLTGETGKRKGQTVKGRYQIDGKTLRICLGAERQDTENRRVAC